MSLDSIGNLWSLRAIDVAVGSKLLLPTERLALFGPYLYGNCHSLKLSPCLTSQENIRVRDLILC